jgi:hypothetical protein
MSQIDDNVWLQFIARETLDNGSLTAAQFPVSSQKPCYDFNLKKGCFKTNCLLKHIAYPFKHRPGLFNNGVRTYSEYVLKGEAVHEV